MIDLAAESPDQHEIQALLQASDTCMAGLYPAESNHLLDVRQLCLPEVTCIVARRDGPLARGTSHAMGSKRIPHSEARIHHPPIG